MEVRQIGIRFRRQNAWAYPNGIALVRFQDRLKRRIVQQGLAIRRNGQNDIIYMRIMYLSLFVVNTMRGTKSHSLPINQAM